MFKSTFKKIALKQINATDKSGLNKQEAEAICVANYPLISNLAYRLWAEKQRSLLIVLQGMDTAGKDGAIKHIVGAVNPQSCPVHSFVKPSLEELAHDFLWRIHQRVPQRGNVAIFNRSHYEDVLVVRVHNLVPEEIWKLRYQQINDFERMLVESGTVILKFCLHISKEEQRKRLQARLDDPNKRWKFSQTDIEERKLWDNYMEAYEVALNKTNTEWAPWHIIPCDKKWHRNLMINMILRETLEKMNPQFPKSPKGINKMVIV